MLKLIPSTFSITFQVHPFLFRFHFQVPIFAIISEVGGYSTGMYSTSLYLLILRSYSFSTISFFGTMKDCSVRFLSTSFSRFLISLIMSGISFSATGVRLSSKLIHQLSYHRTIHDLFHLLCFCKYQNCSGYSCIWFEYTGWHGNYCL